MAALMGQGSMVRLPTRTPAFRTAPPQRGLSTRTPSLSTRHTSELAMSTVGRSSFVKVDLPSSFNKAQTRIVTTLAAKVTGKIKLALTAGKANPAPPVGPALGSKGVNIMAFCKQYNAETQKMAGEIVPVEITVYEDRSFTFILKTPPASFLIKKAAGIQRASPKPNQEKVGKITLAQVKEIAQKKLPDTNATKLESVEKMVKGTARSMGVVVVE